MRKKILFVGAVVFIFALATANMSFAWLTSGTDVSVNAQSARIDAKLDLKLKSGTNSIMPDQSIKHYEIKTDTHKILDNSTREFAYRIIYEARFETDTPAKDPNDKSLFPLQNLYLDPTIVDKYGLTTIEFDNNNIVYGYEEEKVDKNPSLTIVKDGTSVSFIPSLSEFLKNNKGTLSISIPFIVTPENNGKGNLNFQFSLGSILVNQIFTNPDKGDKNKDTDYNLIVTINNVSGSILIELEDKNKNKSIIKTISYQDFNNIDISQVANSGKVKLGNIETNSDLTFSTPTSYTYRRVYFGFCPYGSTTTPQTIDLGSLYAVMKNVPASSKGYPLSVYADFSVCQGTKSAIKDIFGLGVDNNTINPFDINGDGTPDPATLLDCHLPLIPPNYIASYYPNTTWLTNFPNMLN